MLGSETPQHNRWTEAGTGLFIYYLLCSFDYLVCGYLTDLVGWQAAAAQARSSRPETGLAGQAALRDSYGALL